MSFPLKLLATLAVLYALAVGAMAVFQRSFQYFPDRSAMDPARAGFPAAESLTLATPDGQALVAWWKPPAGDAAPAYLYLHGNGGSLMLRGERLALLARDGSGVLALSWRGYGGSTGSPTEEGLHRDAAAAYTWLVERVGERRIVLFGESLGTGPALRLAAGRAVRAVILDSPYAAIVDIAARVYFWLPVRWLMRDPFRAADDARRVSAPVLVVHCRADPVIPLAEARRLAAALPTPPRFEIVEGPCHVPSLALWPTPPDLFLRGLAER